MSYTVQINDAEIRSKLGNSLNESVSYDSAQALAAMIEAKTGIRVFVRLNETTKSYEVKRLLIN